MTRNKNIFHKTSICTNRVKNFFPYTDKLLYLYTVPSNPKSGPGYLLLWSNSIHLHLFWDYWA